VLLALVEAHLAAFADLEVVVTQAYDFDLDIAH
jgi:hypothetical protein